MYFFDSWFIPTWPLVSGSGHQTAAARTQVNLTLLLQRGGLGLLKGPKKGGRVISSHYLKIWWRNGHSSLGLLGTCMWKQPCRSREVTVFLKKLLWMIYESSGNTLWWGWIIVNSCMKKHELIRLVIHELSVMHKYWHYLVLDLMQERYFNQCSN